MFEIKKAVRKGAKTCVSLIGESGSGKTYSAIRLARGLVGKNGKIGVIDTEQRRASLYADCFGGFDVIDLEPPYSPARYREAIKTFKDAGYDVVVIDSMSHEWEGEGGVIWMADHATTASGKKRNDMGKWAEPKAEHRLLMTSILNSGMHCVLCYRVKFPLLEVENENGKKEYIRGEPTPVCEPNVDYDVTVKLYLDKESKHPTIQKCPEGIEYLFPNNQFITEQAGQGIIDWLNSPQRDKDAIIAEGITKKDLKAWFATLNPSERSLARKYASEIKANQVAEPVPEPKPAEVKEPVTNTFHDVEEI
jgi:hypothetical protein